jgi:hypothetical protein
MGRERSCPHATAPNGHFIQPALADEPEPDHNLKDEGTG